MEEGKGGIYQAIDTKSLDKLLTQQESQISENKERLEKWTNHYNEYDKLNKKLVGLCEKTHHEYLIPISKKAIMPGRLVHTNEIMVLLGDNWFADRSNKQARDIVQRRITQCKDMLKDLEKEKQLLENWKKETQQLRSDSAAGDGNMEIREPFDEESEKKWLEEHKKKMKAHKLKEKSKKSSDEKTDKEIWERLEELEIEEELDDYLDREEEENDDDDDGEDSGDWSESPPLSDDEDVIPNSPPPKRRVSFGNVIHHELKEPSMIEFSHHGEVSPSQTQELHPGNLSRLFNPSNTSQESVKSILKPFDPHEIKKIEEEDHDDMPEKRFEGVREPYLDPVSQVVTEKEIMSHPEPPQEPARKMSKFKMSRLKQ